MGPGAYPPQPTAAEQVRLPAIFLLVTGILGALSSAVSLLFNLLGAGMGLAGMVPGEAAYDDALGNLMSGTLGVVFAIVGLAVAGLIVFGALKMKDLQSHALAMVAAIVAMVPCVSPCCLLGLPVGIWALVVLLKPEVKAAFRG